MDAILGSGEMFFYYFPKGILRRRPVNVYEVPKRFNINEDQYLGIVKELYEVLKSLKQDFVDTEQDLWNSVTISIANFKFKVEYSYESLPKNDNEIHERNVIWKYNYLKLGGENRQERKILEDYFSKSKPTKKQVYETGLYIKKDNNRIGFDKEESNPEEFIMYEKDDILKITNNITNNIKSKIFSNSIFNKSEEKYKKEYKKELEKNYKLEKDYKKEDDDTENTEKKHSRNQILNN